MACALARLGTPVGLIGRLGEDAIGSAFLELFKGRGVDVRALQSDASHPSRVVLVRRHANGERVFQGFAGDQAPGFRGSNVGSWLFASGLARLGRAGSLVIGRHDSIGIDGFCRRVAMGVGSGQGCWSCLGCGCELAPHLLGSRGRSSGRPYR